MSSDEQSNRSLTVGRSIIITNTSMDSTNDDSLLKDGNTTLPPGLLSTASKCCGVFRPHVFSLSPYFHSNLFLRDVRSVSNNDDQLFEGGMGTTPGMCYVSVSYW